MGTPGQHLDEYVRALNTHRLEIVRPLIDDEAVFIFSEGTYIGIEAIGEAISRTFAAISDEHYAVTHQQWTEVTEDTAICFYDFSWKGIIDGHKASGRGRGTSVLRKKSSGWKIIHEHLGPAPQT
jgi:ketosteroid isomerase-like protein